MSNKIKIRIFLNLMIAILAFGAWIAMFFRIGTNPLTSTGFGSLKYFTVLSNLFAGCCSVMMIYFLLKNKNNHLIELLKYSSAICLGLTFLTVVVFLGPLLGYRAMYRGANFYFHLIVPLLAIFEIIYFNKEIIIYKEIFYATIPMIIYGCFYYLNIIINGIGEGRHSNDWYGFARWGIPQGIIVFIVIYIITFIMGILIKKVRVNIDK